MASHDYTKSKRYWGHDIYYTPQNNGMQLNAGGWGKGINNGDFILLTNPASGMDTRYQVDSITYEIEPSDMWRAVLIFSPRQKDGDHE